MQYRVEVRVSLKKGMLDAEGETIAKSLSLLGFGVKKCETVKDYVLSIEAKSQKDAIEQAKGACEKLLANPVIQDYEVREVK
jgi:phosphoribosylformylglycinamidine synthase